MKTILAILLFASAISANVVRLSDYATPDDGMDDSPGLQDAVRKMPRGGTIIIDAGVWNLNSPVNFITYATNNSFIIKGQKGAVIKPRLTSTEILFRSGNQNQIQFEDLIVIGEGKHADFRNFLYVDNSVQLRITGCQFFGLSAQSSVIFIGNADAVIKDTLFHGLSSGEGVIRANESRGLTITDSEFIDYGNFDGTYYSKTPNGNPAWIKATSTSTTVNAMGQRGIALSNVRFDEGALYALDASGISYIQAKGVLVNVSGMDDGAGINLNNVKYAEIKISQFGHATAPRPAIKAFNNTTVYIDSVTVGAGVYFGLRDPGSQAFFNLRACSAGCTFMVQ